jgi:hypothetical protein
MHHFRVFFIVALLLSLGSCSAPRSFSKRKYLPGKFWNSSGTKSTNGHAKSATVLKANERIKKRKPVLVEELKDTSHLAGLNTLLLVPKPRMEPVENDHKILSSITLDERNTYNLEKVDESTNKAVAEANHQRKKPDFFEVLTFVIVGALVLGILFTIGGITCISLAFVYGISNYSWLLAVGILLIIIGAAFFYFVFT